MKILLSIDLFISFTILFVNLTILYSLFRILNLIQSKKKSRKYKTEESILKTPEFDLVKLKINGKFFAGKSWNEQRRISLENITDEEDLKSFSNWIHRSMSSRTSFDYKQIIHGEIKGQPVKYLGVYVLDVNYAKVTLSYDAINYGNS